MTLSSARLLSQVALSGVLVCMLLVFVGSAHGGRGLIVGASENMAEWNPVGAVTTANDLGLGAFRVTVQWTPGARQLSGAQAELLTRAIDAVRQQRIVLAVYGPANSAPATEEARVQYCTFVENLLVRYSQISDIVIWNEPNKGAFWSPQCDTSGTSVAPSRYAQLLAACYPKLHQVRTDMNVIAALGSQSATEPTPDGPSSTSPVKFIAGMGTAYRALGLSGRLFDTFGQNVYGTSSLEPPSQAHPRSGMIGEGDYSKLISTLTTAFHGTQQPLPGTQGVSIWYMEDGFQTTIDPAKASSYSGSENVPVAPYDVTAPAGVLTQASQLVSAIELAYCQPDVGAFFNFLLQDEPDLSGWQSGVLWADGTPKPAYAALKQVVTTVDTHQVNCNSATGASS